MTEWWQSLTTANQWFYAAAGFFSFFLLWQLAAALIGLGGGEDASAHGDVSDVSSAPGDHPEFAHEAAYDAHSTLVAFKLFSVRSILAFATLFSWACALYLNHDVPMGKALIYGIIWGLAAMVMVSLLLFMMRRMTETGNPRIATCVGVEGVVHLNIPAGGVGEARVTVSGVVTHLKARASRSAAIQAGTPIRVIRVLGPATIEVEAIQ